MRASPRRLEYFPFSRRGPRGDVPIFLSIYFIYESPERLELTRPKLIDCI
jgi:hypothetical protein